MTTKKRITERSLKNVPNQSGAYRLNRGKGDPYVGSAQAGRLRERLAEQLAKKRGVTTFQYRPTSSTEEARRLEKKYRNRLNPKQRV